jgi:hypothetical protein
VTWNDWTVMKVEVWQKHTCNSRCKSMVCGVNKGIFSVSVAKIRWNAGDSK